MTSFLENILIYVVFFSIQLALLYCLQSFFTTDIYDVFLQHDIIDTFWGNTIDDREELYNCFYGNSTFAFSKMMT